MNREIKFKVWCKENEEFVQFNKMGFLEDGSLWYVQGVDENEEETDPPYFENQNNWELMEYTGLKDKNGVEIYDGHVFWSDHSGEYAYVEYQEGAFYIIHTVTSEKTLLSKEHGDWIIRGNIYENSDLLEREAE